MTISSTRNTVIFAAVFLFFINYNNCLAQIYSVENKYSFGNINFDEYANIFYNQPRLYSTDQFFMIYYQTSCLLLNKKTGEGKKIELLNIRVKNKFNKKVGFNTYFKNDTLLIENNKNYYLLVFKNERFTLIHEFKIKKSARNYVYKNSEIIGFDIYNYHWLENKNLRSGYFEYNLKNQNYIEKNFDFKYIGLTHFAPNNFIDYYEKNILVIDPVNYSINVYNTNSKDSLINSFICPDSIFKPDENLKKVLESEKMINLSKNYVGNYIEEMTKLMYKTNRVYSGHFIDENKILIKLFKYKQDSFISEDHIWKKIDGKFSLTKILTYRSANMNDSINEKKFIPFLTPSSRQFIQEGRMYVLYWGNKFSNANNYNDMLFNKSRDLNLKVIELKIE
jgi:hypothetical protein